MAWNALFTTDVGLRNMLTIGFILAMATYLIRFALWHMREEEHKLSHQQLQPPV